MRADFVGFGGGVGGVCVFPVPLCAFFTVLHFKNLNSLY